MVFGNGSNIATGGRLAAPGAALLAAVALAACQAEHSSGSGDSDRNSSSQPVRGAEAPASPSGGVRSETERSSASGEGEPLDPIEPAEAPEPTETIPFSPAAGELVGRALTYFEQRDRRRIYIQTDRPMYRPGDWIWIKTWTLESSRMRGADSHEGLTYELVDPKGETVARKNVEAEGGHAHNHFVVRSNMAGGRYTLRVETTDGHEAEREVVVSNYSAPTIKKKLEFLRKAYGAGDRVVAVTELKRGTDEPLSDQKIEAEIRVAGEVVETVEATTDEEGNAQLEFELPDTLDRADGILTATVEAAGARESIARRIPIVQQDLALDLYPEGGDLVEGLKSRVYFDADKPNGNPADVEGYVERGDGKTIARFRSYKNGMGRFEFTPKPGDSYRVHVTKPEGIDRSWEMPEARPRGCVLRHVDDFDGQLAATRVKVRCTSSRKVVLGAFLREQALDTAAVRVPTGEPAVVYLEPHGTKRDWQGVTRVTLFDRKLVPLAERIVYRRRRSRLKIDVEPQSDSYGPRDRVELEVTTETPSGEPVAARLAMSVVDDKLLSLADAEMPNLLPALLLTPEIPGDIEKPNFYFELDERKAARALDLLMGTRGYRRFRWARVLDNDGWRAKRSVPVADETETRRDDTSKSTKQKRGESIRATTSKHREEARKAPTSVPGQNAAEPEAREDGPAESVEEGEPERSSQRRMAKSKSNDGDAVLESLGAVGASSDSQERGGESTGDSAAEKSAGIGEIGEVGDREQGAGAVERGIDTGQVRVDDLDPQVTVERRTEQAGTGQLHPNSIRQTLLSASGRLQACYERHLKKVKDPSASGRVVVRFTVDRSGAVTTSETAENSVGGSVGECVSTVVSHLPFSRPKDGDVTLRKTFEFDTRGSPDAVPSSASDRPEYSSRVEFPASASEASRADSRWARVREFPVPEYEGEPPEKRTDFRDTVYWNPDIRTGDDGRATVEFALSDAVTSFRITTEGVGDGFPGRDESVIESTQPFSIDAEVPAEVTRGDTFSVPVRLTNRREESTTVDLTIEVGDGLALRDRAKFEQQVPLEPGERSRVFVPLEATESRGTSRVTLRATTGSVSDSIDEEVALTPKGIPRQTSASGSFETSVRRRLEVGEHVDGSLRAEAKVFVNPVSSVVEAREGMLEQPHGCFEQTSSSNHPNVMLLRYLRASGQASPDLASRAKELMREGYERLTTFEIEGGGFSFHGDSPALTGITAYGLLQFWDMKQAGIAVESGLLKRTVQSLLERRTSEGAFREHEDSATDGTPTVTAYTAFALSETTYADRLGPTLDRERRRAVNSEDPYRLALAANTLANLDDDRAERARRRLADMQGDEGGWTGAETSMTGSGGRNLEIETTALALLALVRSDDYAQPVQRAARWLHEERSGDGLWGATQATVLTLEALAAFRDKYGDSGSGGGRVTVYADRKKLESVQYRSDREAPVVFDVTEAMTDGSADIELARADDPSGRLKYSISATYRTRNPRNDAAGAVKLDVSHPDGPLEVAETGRVAVELTNAKDEPVGMTLARIGLPAGWSVQNWQLEQLRERDKIAFYEQRPREVTLYLGEMKADASRRIPLEVKASVPGTYTAKPSRAYPYYNDTSVDWSRIGTVEVRQ